MRIITVTIATGQGVKMYSVQNGYGKIASIKEENIYINGDPVLHYIGRDATGNELLRIHNSVPVVIDYGY